MKAAAYKLLLMMRFFCRSVLVMFHFVVGFYQNLSALSLVVVLVQLFVFLIHLL